MDNQEELFYIPEDEVAMDTDNSELGRNTTERVTSPTLQIPLVPIDNDRYDVVIVSSVGLHVEGPIPFINPEIPIEQHAIVQIESNDADTGRISPQSTISAVSPVAFTEEESNQSLDESKESCRKRTLSEDTADDGRLCPICLDNWTNTGEHRICSLKCGHLFGRSCVTRWLDSQSKRTCPTCKKKVGRGDLRFIYANKLIAVDVTELENVRKQLDYVVQERNRISLDMDMSRNRERMLNQEIARLKQQLLEVCSNKPDYRWLGSGSGNSGLTEPVVRLYMDKSLEICRLSGCRVFDADCQKDLIMTSMKSPNTLFAGYGIRKINISQYKPLAFIPLHTLQVRDICFHPENNWVLTASMDKSFKVVSSFNNTAISTTSQSMPLWSCCWDADNQYVLYVGTQSGVVVKYDVRQLAEPVCTLAVPGDMSPVVSVASIPARVGEDLPNGGVVSCKLNSLWVFENASLEVHRRHSLPLDGPFVSMKYETDTRQLLVSSRPNNRISHSRHTLCTLEKDEQGGISCNVVHSFQGGGMQKLLSKSCFLGDKLEYVAAHQESDKSVYLWSIKSGRKVCSVPAHDAVLDLRGVQNQNGSFLVSLTEKKLEFFKFH